MATVFGHRIQPRNSEASRGVLKVNEVPGA